MQIVQVIKNVENIDDEYIEKLQELVLFYWEYKDNNPDIVLAEAQLRVCNLNLNGNSQRTRLRRYKWKANGDNIIWRQINDWTVGSEWLTRVPILIRDVVQSGRTLALGARGRWFKSSHLDTLLQTVTIKLLFISKKFRNLYCKLIKELYEF